MATIAAKKQKLTTMATSHKRLQAATRCLFDKGVLQEVLAREDLPAMEDFIKENEKNSAEIQRARKTIDNHVEKAFSRAKRDRDPQVGGGGAGAVGGKSGFFQKGKDSILYDNGFRGYPICKRNDTD